MKNFVAYLDSWKDIDYNVMSQKIIYIVVSIYHIYQPLHSGRIWHKVICKQSLTGLNSDFSFS